MNNSKKLALAALTILIAGLVAYLTLGRSATKEGPRDTVEQVDQAPPAPKRLSSDDSSKEAAYPMPAMVDDDPEGSLVLEGQVVDENGEGVGGAMVMLSSAPARTTRSEDDGSFSFDKLVSRRYAVHARSDDRIGGPVVVVLSATSDPVLVRIQPGGGLEIEVVDTEGAPIVGAQVSVLDLEGATAQSDSKGLAVLRNLPPGPSVIAASATGYATATTLATVPREAKATGRQRVTLHKGTSVSGTVFTPDGKPLSSAHVIARPVGTFVQLQDPRRDGVATDKDGRFTLPAVPAGGAQLFALHDDYAPTTGERFSVGDSPLQGVDLKMREGASVAGQVKQSDGSASPWATVQVVDASGGGPGGGGLRRKMIAAEDGSFEMKGLPRAELIVHASSETASSENLAVDTRTKARADKLLLTLDVEGEIRGLVVDEAGEPVAEAQVQATPDFWEGADLQELRVRGPAFATTAGDGSFVLRGLPQMKMRLVASRSLASPSSRQRGVAAQTGDTDVRLVLATPGRIIGKVQASDGSTPSIAMVSVGWESGVPTLAGRFTIDEVPPGSFELTVRGPDFATTHRSGVKVEAGETLDLGTITVEKGRSLRGRVLFKGSPVAGAQVALARQLISDGSSLIPRALGDVIDSSTGLRRTISDAKGDYVLPGLGKEELTVAADHGDKGRSHGALVAAGSEDLRLDLELREVGSVRGRVTLNGSPLPEVQVLITSSQGEGQHILIVSSDPQGSFFAERVPAGEHKVSAMMQAFAGAGSMSAVVAKVQAGQETEANLDVVEGSITLAVTVVGKGDAVIDAAQVFLFKGVAKVQTGGELNKLFLNASADAKMSFAMADGKTRFEKITPGPYSLCVIPIRGDMNDPAFGQKLQRHVEQLAVYCQLVEVSESPEIQSLRSEVPEMTPLPED